MPPPKVQEKEIISGFNRCYNSSSIFRLLETIPITEVTPPVAAHAYKKIVELEINYETRNPASAGKGGDDQPRSFFRSAFISRLLEIICNGKDPAAILGGLTAVMRDKNSDDQDIYKAKLLEELLVCVTDGLFSLQDICKAIHILAIFYPENKRCREVVDKLWFGLIDQSKDMILKVLEKKSVDCWLQFKVRDIVEILRVLQQLKYDTLSPGFLRMLSGWLVVNIHTVTEQDMLAITYSFLKLEYTDTALITALEKIIKKKGCKIMEYDLICTICSYCLAMRIRSPIILEGVGQYFIEHHQALTT